jgi:hypothetical protein
MNRSSTIDITSLAETATTEIYSILSGLRGNHCNNSVAIRRIVEAALIQSASLGVAVRRCGAHVISAQTTRHPAMTTAGSTMRRVEASCPEGNPVGEHLIKSAQCELDTAIETLASVVGIRDAAIARGDRKIVSEAAAPVRIARETVKGARRELIALNALIRKAQKDKREQKKAKMISNKTNQDKTRWTFEERQNQDGAITVEYGGRRYFLGGDFKMYLEKE